MNDKSPIQPDNDGDFLMRMLFDGYYWFDEGLQRSMQAKNIPTLSRSQSMVMICLGEGIRRPSALARKMRVSRQAIQKTLADLEAKGYLTLVPDTQDRRAKSVRLSKIGKQRQVFARDTLQTMETELSARLGSSAVAALSKALSDDWGEPPSG